MRDCSKRNEGVRNNSSLIEVEKNTVRKERKKKTGNKTE